MNPSGAGLELHRLKGHADRAFLSVQISRDIRIIVYRTSSSLMLCYIDYPTGRGGGQSDET